RHVQTALTNLNTRQVIALDRYARRILADGKYLMFQHHLKCIRGEKIAARIATVELFDTSPEAIGPLLSIYSTMAQRYKHEGTGEGDVIIRIKRKKCARTHDFFRTRLKNWHGLLAYWEQT
ncbi:unnamed protein product, partial [Amoebophrya sp. A120]